MMVRMLASPREEVETDVSSFGSYWGGADHRPFRDWHRVCSGFELADILLGRDSTSGARALRLDVLEEVIHVLC